MDKKCLLMFSGGQDSTTVLSLLLEEEGYRPENVYLLAFDYGQRHKRDELRAAQEIVRRTEIPRANFEIVSIPPRVLRSSSPLVDLESDLGQYDGAENLPTGLEATFVPFRNLLFLTIAGNRAISLGCRTIATGVAGEDDEGYPDCRESFLMMAESTLNEALGEPDLLQIYAPLVHKNKRETVEIAMRLGENSLELLSYSHTCYEGLRVPCGRCHACLLRARGFEEAGIADPLVERLRRLRLL